MSVSLFWTCMLYGPAGIAAGDGILALATPSQVHPKGMTSGHTLQQGEQIVSLDATTTPLLFHRAQAESPTRLPSFAAPADEVVPPYASRAPGTSLLSMFFPISIQPHAP
jgi:hypothetical protein